MSKHSTPVSENGIIEATPQNQNELETEQHESIHDEHNDNRTITNTSIQTTESTSVNNNQAVGETSQHQNSKRVRYINTFI
jgi:hypothetical protein